MPKNKTQGIIFGIIMSYAMAFGMEIYNTAINHGYHLAGGGFSSMTNVVFLDALKEMTFMGLFVILFSNLWGNRLGAAFAVKHCDPEKDNPYICRLLRQAGTIAVMCPTMSLVATILFNIIMAGMPVSRLPAHLGRDSSEKLPHGVLLEYVCRGSFYTLDLRKNIPLNMILPLRQIFCRSLLSF